MSTVIYATPVAVDPRDYAHSARMSAGIAAPLTSLGAVLLVAALTFMDPARAGSVPRALAGGPIWLDADRVLVAVGLAALTAAVVLALTSLRDAGARLRLGRHALSDGSYALAVFVLLPWALTTSGHSGLSGDDWARPTATLVLLTVGLTVIGALLVGSSVSRRRTP